MKKQSSTIILTIFLVVVIIICFAFVIADQLGWLTTKTPNQLNSSIRNAKCDESYAGVWLPEFKECEGIAKEICLANGGYFNECASACRHNPSATVCTMQCIPVCEYAVINEKADLIRVTFPRANQIIEGSYLEVIGEARGNWFFEASFPVQIKSLDGKGLQEGFASAEGEWMTEEFVGFRTELKLKSNIKGKINLVLKKDNPSGLSANDDELIIPIEIK